MIRRAPPTPNTVLLPGGRVLDLSAPRVMGILNVTPDSFSDGGRFAEPEAAVERALALAAAGAAVIDIGGESTRPGADPVAAEEELRRVVPVIERLVARGCPAPLSIDTRKAAVAREALAAGAALVNDVSGLADPALAEVVAAAGAALVIGHMQGEPATMQRDPRYRSVVDEVEFALAAASARAEAVGVEGARLLFDPGIGFGKTAAHNLALLGALPRLAALGPLVVGLSRKSLLGTLLGGRPTDARDAAGLGGAVWCALRGARLIRTHEVGATCDALAVARAFEEALEDAARAEGAADDARGGGRPHVA